jgi:hypothetical protein
MSGTGMKQARQVVGGARRRGGAKPRGRNVTGGLGTTGGMWLPTTGKTLKGTKPREKRDAAVNRTFGLSGSRSISRCCDGDTLKGSRSP